MSNAIGVIILICIIICFYGFLVFCACLYKIQESAKAKKTINKIKEREAEKVR